MVSAALAANELVVLYTRINLKAGRISTEPTLQLNRRLVFGGQLQANPTKGTYDMCSHYGGPGNSVLLIDGFGVALISSR